MRAPSLLLSLAGASALPADYVRQNAALLWDNFKAEHGKSYASNVEEASRYGIFQSNMQRAVELEAANPGATFGANKFSDLSEEEFAVYHSLQINVTESPPPMFSDAEVAQALASSVDWRSKGAVTQVKNQQQCGSCWAFSATGGIEGQWAIRGHGLVSVSEQELVSCDRNDNGCGGGLQDRAYSWLVSAKGGKIVTESAYPYRSGGGSSGSCRSTSGMSVGATITGHKNLAHSESQMAAYVSASGPLPIGVDAGPWQSYRGGVMSSCRAGQLDHGVLIVGKTSQYWIVKNSWGSGWGESGYIRLAYGSNQCGISQSPIAAVV